MHTVLALGLALSLAGAEVPAAMESTTPEKAAPSAVVVERAPEVVVAPVLTQVELREPLQQDMAIRSQPPRGFWWTVAAIVVAGVILAVIV